jgi:hypothetical protein
MLIEPFECVLAHHPDRRKGHAIGRVNEDVEGCNRLCRKRYNLSPTFFHDPGSECAVWEPRAGPVVCTEEWRSLRGCGQSIRKARRAKSAPELVEGRILNHRSQRQLRYPKERHLLPQRLSCFGRGLKAPQSP